MVVGIIFIVAAIAIPNLLKSRVAANEASAVASLRAIDAAQSDYLQVYPDAGTYACQLSYLGPPLSGSQVNSTAADLIDIRQASGIQSGYSFYMSCIPASASAGTSYEVQAAPTGASVTGSSCGTANGRCFFTNAAGSVYQLNGPGSSDGTSFSLSPIS